MEFYEEIKTLGGFKYTASREKMTDLFLFHIVRAGCDYRKGIFNISRENDYPFYTLHYIFDGYAFFRIAGKEYLLKKGDYFIILPGQAHSYGTVNQGSVGLLWAEMSGGNCSELLSCFRANNIFTLFAACNQKIGYQLINIVEYLKGENINKYDLSAYIYQLIMNLIEAVNTVTKNVPSKLIQQALLIIDQSFIQPLSVSEIADRLSVSNNYLTRVFKKQIGITTAKYINLKKIEYACHLLLTTNLSCEAVSEKIGVGDVAYFNRIFKKTMGVTPGQYRRQ